jgi:hypothetical protein
MYRILGGGMASGTDGGGDDDDHRHHHRGVVANLGDHLDDAVDGEIDCCLDLPDVGAPPPDWASRAPSTWRGMVWDDHGQVFATEWWFDRFDVDRTEERHFSPMGGFVVPPNLDITTHRDDDGEAKGSNKQANSISSMTTGTINFHTVRQVAFERDGIDNGLPLVFTFPSLAEGRQDMHFLYRTMNHSLPNDALLFELPKGCEQRRCPSGARISQLSTIG